jgi:hypothetical protein
VSARQTSAAPELAQLAASVADLAARLAALESAHRSGKAHATALDKATDAIAERAAAAVQAARDAAAAERSKRAAAAAGERVRVRAVREVDAWIGPRSERLRLSPGNVRADVCRVMDRAAWAAIVGRSDEAREALDGGALVVEDVAPDEPARVEARA